MAQPAPLARLFLVLTALLACTSRPSPAQDTDPTIAGLWRGDLTRPGGGLLEMVFWVQADEGGWTGLVDTPAQGIFGLPMTIGESDEGVSMTVAATGGEYRASLSDDGQQLNGSWLQRGSELDLVCTRQPPPPAVPEQLRAAVAGTWEGLLEVGPVELRLVLVVDNSEDGPIRGHMASPDQGNQEFPITRTDLLDDGRLRFCIGSAFARFRMAPGADQATLEGQYAQGKRSFDISLARVDAPTRVNRPQEPKPPFPYRAQDVEYENETGGVTLAGTLTVPEGNGPFAAVLLISGSGPQDRDESLFQHKPFWVIADHLTRRGVAVLRVDDRGVGGSSKGENQDSVTTVDFAEDVLAGVAFLKARDDIAPDRIGLMGHSEGGIIAPMVATRSADVAFIVLLAGTGIPGAEIVVMQNELLRSADSSDEEMPENPTLDGRLLALAKDASLSAAEIEAAAREILRELPEFSDDEAGAAEIQAVIDQLTTPWVRWFFRHDPAPVLEKVRCPVLAINGTLDLQVPCEVNLGAIEQALARGGNSDYEVRAFEGLNHLFQHCETGHTSEYGHIEETFSPEVLDYVTDWVVKRFVSPR